MLLPTSTFETAKFNVLFEDRKIDDFDYYRTECSYAVDQVLFDIKAKNLQESQSFKKMVHFRVFDDCEISLQTCEEVLFNITGEKYSKKTIEYVQKSVIRYPERRIQYIEDTQICKSSFNK